MKQLKKENAIPETVLPQFSHAIPVFPVSDVAQSIEFYTGQLGFKVDFRWGDPCTYAGVSRESVKIHFTKKEDAFLPSSQHTALYVFVYEVNLLYEEYQRRGVLITNPIADRDYGMRDFDIRDNNGFILSFATGLDRLK